MCGIVGLTNLDNNVSEYIEIIKQMKKELNRGTLDEQDAFLKKDINLHHTKLAIISVNNDKQTMSIKFNNNIYTILYNGKLYNSDELKLELKENDFDFSTNSDTEILLKGFIHWGYKLVNHLNGVFGFAIWNEENEELYLARDHFGIKPLYYTEFNNTFIFSSEVKSIIKYPNFKTEINKFGISELLGLGPAHTSGTCIFNNIYELKPAHFGIYNKSGIHIERYWKLKSKPHEDNLENTCENVKYLIEDSIKRQLVSDGPICTMLSGGLDSSIITTYVANYMKQKDIGILNTFSVDYIDNDKNFIKTDFQPNSDKYYIDIMVNKLGTKHSTFYIDTPELANTLEDAMIARDFPGMADVDSSMLLFCKEISKYAKVAISGECADEIFRRLPLVF